MRSAPQAQIDEQTGIRLTVEYDIPAHPKVTAFVPAECTLETEEINEILRKLMHMAGITPPVSPIKSGG